MSGYLIIRPIGTYSAALSQYPNSTENWDKVDEAVCDEDSTYVYRLTDTTAYDRYEVPIPDEQPGHIISVSVKAMCKCSASGYSLPVTLLLSQPTIYYGSEQAITSNVYTEFTEKWTINPHTGLAWEWADLISHAFYAGITLAGDNVHTARCSQLWVEIEYYKNTGRRAQIIGPL